MGRLRANFGRLAHSIQNAHSTEHMRQMALNTGQQEGRLAADPFRLAALAPTPETGVGKGCSDAVPFSSINLPTPTLGGVGDHVVVEGGGRRRRPGL